MYGQASMKPSQDDELRGMEAARQLMGFFPNGAASDPKIFEAGLCQLLSVYPQWALKQACDVHHGLPSAHRFLPSLAEIREYLEALLAADRRHRELIERWKSQRYQLLLRIGERGRRTKPSKASTKNTGASSILTMWREVDKQRCKRKRNSGR